MDHLHCQLLFLIALRQALSKMYMREESHKCAALRTVLDMGS